jgi:curved DNA-binding protein
MNPYEVLGLNRTASADDIKKAYRKLASQHHPDKGGDTARFQEIQQAYDILSDPEKKSHYDNPPQNHFQFNFNDSNFNDILAQFGFGGHPFSRVHPRKNQDIRSVINLNLEDILEDCDKTLLIQTSGQHRTVNVKIPKGITQGTTIKYPNLGDNIFPNLPPGDLLLTINIITNPQYQISGLDLITNLTIDCFQAILGCEKVVTGIDNRQFVIKIPAGTQPNAKLKLTGQGLPAFQQDIKGNLLIQINVSIPTNLTDSQKTLLLDLIRAG